MVLAEYIERQITVVIVEAVEESSFLPAMDRKVGRVQILSVLRRGEIVAP
jgi:hypothetical protein